MLIQQRSRRLKLLRETLALDLAERATTGLAALFAGLVCAMTLAAALGVIAVDAWCAHRNHVVACVFGALMMLVGTLALWWLLLMLRSAALPAGVCLPRQAALPLYAKVDRMARRFRMHSVDAIWITSELNASVLQRPRWGLVGRMENHLLLGLPLVYAVSDRQLSVILAHEFAHLATQRKGMDAWARHCIGWWFRITDAIVEASVPVLSRTVDGRSRENVLRAARLSRLEELEADNHAAQVVGAQRVGESLVELALKQRFLDGDYWRRVLSQSARLPYPRIRPYRDMAVGMAAGFRPPSAEDIDAWRSLLRAGGGSDAGFLHPDVSDRLRALSVTLSQSYTGHSEAVVSAAEVLLKPLLPTLAWVFDQAWWHEEAPNWHERFLRAREIKRALARTAPATETSPTS